MDKAKVQIASCQMASVAGLHASDLPSGNLPSGYLRANGPILHLPPLLRGPLEPALLGLGQAGHAAGGDLGEDAVEFGLLGRGFLGFALAGPLGAGAGGPFLASARHAGVAAVEVVPDQGRVALDHLHLAPRLPTAKATED